MNKLISNLLWDSEGAKQSKHNHVLSLSTRKGSVSNISGNVSLHRDKMGRLLDLVPRISILERVYSKQMSRKLQFACNESC